MDSDPRLRPTPDTQGDPMMSAAVDLTRSYLLITGTDLADLDGGETFWSKLATDDDHRQRVG